MDFESLLPPKVKENRNLAQKTHFLGFWSKTASVSSQSINRNRPPSRAGGAILANFQKPECSQKRLVQLPFAGAVLA